MPEGGYAASSQFKAIADTATGAALSVAQMASNFAAITASMYTMSNAVQSFAQLQQTLVLANSVAQGSSEQLNQMTKSVRDFALAYKFSATEGASALYFLSSAGYTVNQSLQAMNAVMLYSQGTLSDVAHSAETLSTAMSAFGLAASDAGRVANLFMASIAATQASPEKLAYAMRQVAPVAAAMGASIEQTVGALSELFNVGNRGQQAGTILRDVLLRLSAPTAATREMFADLGVAIQTVTGESRNFVDVLTDISKLHLSVASLDTIFGTRGTAGAEVLLKSLDPASFKKQVSNDPGYADRVNQTQQQLADQAKVTGQPVKELKTDFDLMTATLNNTQMATRIANQQLITLAGSFSLARNAVTEVGISIGEQFAPALQRMSDGITNAVIGFRALNTNQKSLIVDLPLIAVGILAAQKAVTGMLSASASLINNGDAFGLRTAATNARTLAGELRPIQQFFDAHGAALTLGRLPGGGQFFRNPNTGAIVPPANVTTQSANAFTGAPTSGGSFLGAAVGLIGTVLTVGTIALIAAQTLPLIVDYIKNYNVPDADIDAKNYQGEAKRIVSSTGLGGATPIDQYKQLTDQLKSVNQAFNDLNAGVSVNQRNLDKATDSLRSYLVAKAKGAGATDIAANLEAGGSVEGHIFEGTNAGVEGVSSQPTIDDRTADFIARYSDSTTTNLTKQIAQAKSNIVKRTESLKSIPDAINTYNEALRNLQERPGMDALIKFDKAKSDRDAAETAGNFTYQSKALALAFEKEARSAKLQAEKLVAGLSTDPLEQERVDIALANDTAIKKWEDWAAAEAQKIEQQYSTMFAHGDLGKALTGQSYVASHIVTTLNDATGKSQSVFATTYGEDGKPQMIKGALDVLKAGGSDQQVKDAFVAAIQERISAITAAGSKAPDNVVALLNRMDAASAEQAVAWITSRNVDIAKIKATTVDRQRTNLELVQTLRDALFGQQQNLLNQVFTAGGSQDFSVKLNADTIGINKTFEDAIKQLQEYEKKYLLDLEGRFKQDPTLKAQWEQFKNSYIAIVTRTRNDALNNLVEANRNSQQSAINTIKNATDQALLGQSQISGQIEAFMKANGANVPTAVTDARQQDLIREQYAKADADLRAMQEQRDALIQHMNVASRAGAKPIKTPEFSIAPEASAVGESGKSQLNSQAFQDTQDKLNAELVRLADYKKMQDAGIDAYKAIESTQALIAGYKAKLAGSSLLPDGDSAKAPKVENPQGDPAASRAVASANATELNAVNLKIAAQEKYIQLLKDQYALVNTNANKANSDYKQEQANLDETKRLYERNGTALQGLSYGIKKVAHDSQTDFQIAAAAYQTFATSTASNLTDLITGQQKDWHVALANIARDIASTILKALILRSISGIAGGLGFSTGSLFSTPTPHANGAAFFADGGMFTNGIFNSPTMFKFAQGGKMNLGVMAEAGPEAVVPLKTGPDGRLGISMFNDRTVPISGGGGGSDGGSVVFSPQTHFHMGDQAATPNSTSSRSRRDQMVAMKRDFEREHEGAVERVIRKNQRPGGGFWTQQTK